MKFDVITLFPEMFEGILGASILGRAVKNGLVEVNLHQMRQWAWNSYGAVDDRPFGGGPGMVIRPDVIEKALLEVKKTNKGKVILTSARGKTFSQAKAEKMAKDEEFIIICGHYEGVDQRIVDLMVDEEISIGNYVLTGGELPALTMIDAIARLIPGVLGNKDSAKNESFSLIQSGDKKRRVKEYPQYTRPAEFRGIKVPQELLSGDPRKIGELRSKN
ncbi:MAG: tRNA (guanosine(37)-N1)-methyltransferase TrmD [Candidatus Shapirobacteria bacterium]|jgi:tRNA (guanine37-N1)-methyltransferase